VQTLSNSPAIFTIGHSTRPIDELISMLKAYDIKQLVDVRTIPRSKRHPQFNQEALATSLRKEHIGYKHMKELGGLRHPHKDSINTGWHNSGFRGYADYMQERTFREALNTLVALSEQKTTAIMCAESVPWRCHRSLIGDALTVRGIPVEHIFSETKSNPHHLTPFAEVHGTELTYPPVQPSLV
jgi:uncharacterized protein (DUF488 family)